MSGLLTPSLPALFRWATPDPEDDWMMVGHLLVTDAGVILVDPPLVPGLVEAVETLGGARGIVITTHDHSRGAAWLSRRFKLPVHVPAQADIAHLDRVGVSRRTPYTDGDRLFDCMDAIRVRVVLPMWEDQTYVDEMILRFPGDAVATGDIVMGSTTGDLLGCPAGLVPNPDPTKVATSLEAFRKALPSGTATLLASHGVDLIRNLEDAVTRSLP